MNEKKEFYISNINFISGNIDDVEIDLSFIPAMSRRKLSLVDKAAMSVMNKAYSDNNPELIFASEYGELDRLNKIISQYQQDNEVSPFAFSTSVHNSVAGQFSLLNGIKKSYNAISAGKNTFSAGLLESLLCTRTNNDVLYCYADAYKEVKACALSVSKTLKENSIKIKLLTQKQNTKKNQNEFESFIDFVNEKKDFFVSSDGLFLIERGEN